MWAFNLAPLGIRAASSDYSGTGERIQCHFQLVSELLDNWLSSFLYFYKLVYDQFTLIMVPVTGFRFCSPNL